jgi:hypothetical protein
VLLVVQGFPTLIFFRDGQMYRYSGQRTKEDLVQFATGKYQTVKGVPVPGNHVLLGLIASESVEIERAC